ncbi:MAG: energy transducer TonB [Vicingaceae bacterium]
MRTIILLGALLLSYNIHSQSNSETEKAKYANDIFTEVPTMPLFIDAETAEETDSKLYNYFKEKAHEANPTSKGTVYIRFNINTAGKAEKIKILKGENDELNELAKQFVSEMPTWKPGKLKGQKVTVQYTRAVIFK